MVSFGRLFLNHPDLAERIEKEWPINNELLQAWIYNKGPRGYTDYPLYKPK